MSKSAILVLINLLHLQYRMKKGKALEQLVGCIQEFISNSPDTIVSVGKKIVDKNGIMREVDVLVESTFQGIRIFTAFECKDYSTSLHKTKVGVQVVDAVVGKYLDIPQVYEKIIISTTGFTKEAMLKSINNNVKLYSLEELPLDKLILTDNVYAGDSEFDIKKITYIVKDELYIDESYEVDESHLTFKNKEKSAESLFATCVNRMSTEEYAKIVKAYLKNDKKPFIHNLICRTTNNPITAIKADGKICYVFAIKYETIVYLELKSGAPISNKQVVQDGIAIQSIEYSFDNNSPNMTVIRNGDKSNCYTKDSNGYTPFEYYG